MASVAGPRPACVSTYPFPCPGPSSGSGCPAVRCPAHPVSGHLGSSSGSSGPAVWCPPVQRPAVWCPPNPASSPLASAPLRPDLSVSSHLRQWRWGPDGCGGATCTTGTSRGPGGSAPSSGSVNGRGLDDAGDATEVARWSVECRRRTRPGWVRAGWPHLPAARPGRPGRRAERPSRAAARWARERAATRGGGTRRLAGVLGWVRDHGGWSSPSLTPGWADREGPLEVPARIGVRPQRGPSRQPTLPARYRQRSDLRRWVVGLPGLEPGTSSLSEMDGRALC
jgi:hypothetical protein